MRDKSGTKMKGVEIAELQARIASLEAKNSALEARLAALEPKPAPKPRVEESIVRVTEFVGPGEFVMPNSAELGRLRAIVHARYPALAGEFTGRFASDEAHESEQGFAGAFRRLGYMYRLPDGELDDRHANGWWTEECEQWLQRDGGGGRVPLNAWLAAVVAHGDVAYALPDPDQGFASVSVGLLNVGRAPANAWRNLLNGAPLRTPAERKPAWQTTGPQRLNADAPQPIIGRQNRAVTW